MSSLSRLFSMLYLLILFIIYLDIVTADDCYLNPSDHHKVAYTISVSNSPGTSPNYTSVQSAINNIPEGNNQWIRIFVQLGVYRDKVVVDKPCILLEGASLSNTIIVFTLIKKLRRNDYNFLKYIANVLASHEIKPAVAALISAPKASFYHCGFYGVQDTIWDNSGRHYFHECYIHGQVDFICGNGQSIYQNCILKVLGDDYITAQKRQAEEETSGFVFNAGVVIGEGRTYLGRAWGSHSRVIFHTTLSQGCTKWLVHGENFTYVEANCIGPGSKTVGQEMEKRIDYKELNSFTQLSYINNEIPRGWLSRKPTD
ncbi:hypothetical protein MKX01_003222 [Papaver californicum]|nr:hypothetical protein MKX01_003222 [Papaver californicum]